MSKLQYLFVLTVLFAAFAFGDSTARETVIIKVNKPYDKVIAAIEARGGKVTHRFKYTGAIVAEVAPATIAQIRATSGVISVRKDSMMQKAFVRSDPAERRLGRPVRSEFPAQAVTQFSESEVSKMANREPAGFNIDNGLMGLSSLFAAGYQGKGIVVAIIDGGIRPGYPHIDGSVIGGEDLVGDGLGYINNQDDGHATFVAGMIAAHVGFVFSNDSDLVKATKAYAPGAVKPYDATSSYIPMVGTAPAASLYLLRVFPVTGPAPSRNTMAAIERVIELREKYNAGLPGGLNIRVCNLSLGGLTVDPGSTPEDELINALLEHDIVPVICTANSGPAPVTVSSPATSRSSLAVGGASLAHYERIVTEMALGPGQGAVYRPFAGHLMYYASGRGPDANGAIHPNVVASAHYNFGMGFGDTKTVNFKSGTSFSTPTVAGIAAVLAQAYPAATARQIRNAIIASANPNVLSVADVLDQGRGFVDAQAASNLLAAGLAPDTVDPLPDATESVQVNIEQNTSLKVLDGYIQQHVHARPGERREILYRVEPNTTQLIVLLSNFSGLPADQQNQIMGDRFAFGVHSAKTSAVGEGGDYLGGLDVYQTATRVINDPEPGIVRISVNGDSHNAGEVSGDVTIVPLTVTPQPFTRFGQIADAQIITVSFTIPQGASQANFRLAWKEDWGHFPSADLDLLLVSPTSVLNTDGVSSSNPESVSINHPEAGNWTAMILGYAIPAGKDSYEFGIEVDGKVMK
jgi:serine protease AprX